nr:uncharacterized protein LOC109183389 [Ipomoea batatas]
MLRLWNPSGKVELIDVGSGWFIVRCQLQSDCMHVLADGPWKLFDQYVVAQRWKPKFDASTAKVERMVVWIQVPGLPIEYFGSSDRIVISKLKLDMTTTGIQRGKFARGAVEIDLTKPVVAVVMVDDVPRRVEFEGLHVICFDCGEVGHRSVSCPKNSTETKVVQDPLQEANTTDNMHVEETQPPPPIAKHGAWMIVNRKMKGSAKRPEKARGKPTGEVKEKSTRTPNAHKVTQADSSTGGASGAVRAAGNLAQQVHTATNLRGKGNQVDVIPVSNTFSYLQDLESLPEAPVLFEEETAPRSAPKSKNQRRNNKGNKQPSPAPEPTRGRAGLPSEGGPAPNQLFVFGNPTGAHMSTDGMPSGNEASSSKSFTQSTWRVGTGDSLNFWSDWWVGDKPLGLHDNVSIPDELAFAKVSHFILPNRSWDFDRLQAILPREEVNKIRSIPVPLDDLVPDALYWPTSPGGSKQNAIDEGNTSTSKEPRTSTAEPGQERLEKQPTEQAQQPHQEQIEEEQPAQAEGVDSPEQTDAEDDTTRADDDGLKIRAFPKILTKAVEQLSPAQCQAVKDIGLGSLLDLQITNLPHQMGLWLVENFDPRSCTLQLQNGQTIHITADDVAAVLGLPKGNIEITKRKAKAMPEILKE